jgi:hypothetical protein
MSSSRECHVKSAISRRMNRGGRNAMVMIPVEDQEVDRALDEIELDGRPYLP